MHLILSVSVSQSVCLRFNPSVFSYFPSYKSLTPLSSYFCRNPSVCLSHFSRIHPSVFPSQLIRLSVCHSLLSSHVHICSSGCLVSVSGLFFHSICPSVYLSVFLTFSVRFVISVLRPVCPYLSVYNNSVSYSQYVCSVWMLVENVCIIETSLKSFKQ